MQLEKTKTEPGWIRTETDDRNRLFFYEPGDGREMRTLLGRLKKYKGEVWLEMPMRTADGIKSAMFPSGTKPKKGEKLLVVLEEAGAELFMKGVFAALVFESLGTEIACIDHAPGHFISGKPWDRTLMLVQAPDSLKNVMAIGDWKQGDLNRELVGSGEVT